MEIIVNKLRIGEKIGLGFGLVGFLFLLVIWQYHVSFNQALNDYQDLQNVYAKQKDQAMGIEIGLLKARQAEKSFLNTRDSKYARQVEEHIQATFIIVSQMEQGPNRTIAEKFKTQLSKYFQHFQLVEAAWQKKGLDENSGLQGSFRQTVHALEDMAAHLKTDNLYLNLLQIRRAEKDLGLRREKQYKNLALELVNEFVKHVHGSSLQQGLKDELLAEIAIYQNALVNYSSTALNNQDIQGGKGLFRQSAHRLESLINQHYIPDLERNILQLRRREKDYLLRGDEKYVQLAQQEITQIHAQVKRSQIIQSNKDSFANRLEKYRSDFLALIEQNKHIEQVTIDMEQAATNVSQLVNDNVNQSNSIAQEMTQEINSSTNERTTFMLWVVLIAIALGVYFAIAISKRIVNPLRKMAELLEKLTYTELIEKMPYQADGRDEVNAMAGSLNILADHRRRFIQWWQNSMNEAEACEQLEGMLSQLAKDGEDNTVTEIQDLKNELEAALLVKKSLLSKEYQEIRKCNEKILEQSARLNHISVSRGMVEEGANAIRYSAELIHKTLDMLSYNSR